MFRKLKQYIREQLGITRILENQKNQKQMLDFLSTQNKELLKSLLFNNSIVDCEWLKYKNFSPGSWAVDYAFLYTLFRALEGMKPESVLEFGLGETSKLIHQYADFYPNVYAITGEHDEKWIDFFLKNMNIKYDINIKKLELEEVIYKGENTLSYKNIEQEFKNNLFDLIVVDGPFGKGKTHSRTQILHIVKKNLKENFCIIIDDYDRVNEKNTVKDLIALLNEEGRKYLYAVYSGSKQHILICSENLRFLTTLVR